MDPTAPNDNNQNPPGNEPQANNPVQPGQFVVSGEPGTPQDLGQGIPPDLQSQTPASNAAAPADNMPAPDPAFNPVSPTPPESVAAPGPQLANQYQAQPQEVPPMENPQFAPPGSTPPADQTNMQPDPTPFTPPTAPVPTQTQQATSGGGDSKMAKLKIVAIIAAVVGLLIIIAVVVWFFVLNKKSNPPVTQQTDQIEEPALPSPQTGSGFGDIPQASQEATPPAQDQPVAQ